MMNDKFAKSLDEIFGADSALIKKTEVARNGDAYCLVGVKEVKNQKNIKDLIKERDDLNKEIDKLQTSAADSIKSRLMALVKEADNAGVVIAFSGYDLSNCVYTVEKMDSDITPMGVIISVPFK